MLLYEEDRLCKLDSQCEDTDGVFIKDGKYCLKCDDSCERCSGKKDNCLSCKNPNSLLKN